MEAFPPLNAVVGVCTALTPAAGRTLVREAARPAGVSREDAAATRSSAADRAACLAYGAEAPRCLCSCFRRPQRRPAENWQVNG